MADGTHGIGWIADDGEARGLDPRLAIWLSPAFPVGAFAYSHGLEQAATRGWVHDRESLEAWLKDLAELGSLRTDLIVLSSAWRAATAGDRTTLAEVNALALALQPSAERHLETITQGHAFASTIEAAWPLPSAKACVLPLKDDIAYPVAVATAAAAHAIELRGTLAAYALAFMASLVSAAIRLSVIGQTDGQRVIAALMPAVASASQRCAAATLDEIGSLTLRSDVASLAHETLYSRLFRS